VDPEAKIAQFKNMTAADPDNELGHFSLGKACIDAGKFADAEPAFRRVIELKPDFSKAYHLLAETQLKLDRQADAVKTLTKGFEVAAGRGDLIPRDAMADMLQQLGAPVPEIAAQAPASAPSDSAASGDFKCSRCGRPSEQLPKLPFKGQLGEKIHANICKPCWTEWIGMGTKVINEMGLQLADPRHQQAYDEHMTEFLQLDG
jgi:Fe-S cluster biosynthesis and repair protein YggX